MNSSSQFDNNMIMESKSGFEEKIEEDIEATKFTLCVLPTQFGKTFTAIEYMNTEISWDREEGKSIHIVYTMNTLLNNDQYAKRLENIENEYGKGSVCIFNSKKYTGKYKHVKTLLELQGLCFDISTCPRIIVMCSNKIRYTDGFKFIKVLNNQRNIQRLFMYYDELHEYIEQGELRSQIEEIHNFPILRGIMATTATPEKITRETGFWSKLRLLRLKNFNDEDYVGHGDVNFNCTDDFFEMPYVRPRGFAYQELEDQTIGNIQHILAQNPHILAENTRSFIPAHKKTSGHARVRQIVFELNDQSVVVVINGLEKSMQFKDENGRLITLSMISNSEEICETISKKVIDYNLQGRPIVITGFLCVGMGQTLTHRNLGSFTSAIFGHLDLSNDEIYQLFGRITGRMKSWSTYVQTTVYCPSVIMTRCGVMEKCVRNMIENYNGETITRDDYMQPIIEEKATEENIRKPKKIAEKKQKDESDFEYRVLDNFEEAKSFCLATFGSRIQKKSGYPKSLVHCGELIPSIEYLINRKWGLGGKNKFRAFPTESNKWVVYWS